MIYQLSRKLYNIILFEVCKRNQYNEPYKSLSDHDKVLRYINEEFLAAPKTFTFSVDRVEDEYVLRVETKDVVSLVTKLTITEG